MKYLKNFPQRSSLLELNFEVWNKRENEMKKNKDKMNSKGLSHICTQARGCAEESGGVIEEEQKMYSPKHSLL